MPRHKIQVLIHMMQDALSRMDDAIAEGGPDLTACLYIDNQAERVGRWLLEVKKLTSTKTDNTETPELKN